MVIWTICKKALIAVKISKNKIKIINKWSLCWCWISLYLCINSWQRFDIQANFGRRNYGFPRVFFVGYNIDYYLQRRKYKSHIRLRLISQTYLFVIFQVGKMSENWWRCSQSVLLGLSNHADKLLNIYGIMFSPAKNKRSFAAHHVWLLSTIIQQQTRKGYRWYCF